MNEVRKDILGLTMLWFITTLLTFTIHSIMLSETYKKLTEVKEILKNETLTNTNSHNSHRTNAQL